MWLVHSVRIVMAEFVHDFGYPVVVLRVQCIANEALELECAALALVVELVVERFGNIGVHIDKVGRLPLHVAAIVASSGVRWAARAQSSCVVEKEAVGGRAVVVALCMHASTSPAASYPPIAHHWQRSPSLPAAREAQRPQQTAGQLPLTYQNLADMPFRSLTHDLQPVNAP